MTPHDEPCAIAINPRMVGKPADHQRHEGNWQRTIMTPSELMRKVTTEGNAFTCSLKKNGARHRDTFDALNIAALDFDHAGIDQVTAHPLAQWASFAYESASSTPENPRCRLVFALDEALNYEDARQTIQALQHAFGDLNPDTSTKDPVRAWYGAPGRAAHWIGGLLDAGTRAGLLDAMPKPTIVEATPPRPANTSNAWAAKALEDETNRVRSAAQGSRNHTLFGAACKLLEITNSGALDTQTVRQHLAAAAAGTGLEMQEIENTLRSAEERTQGKSRTAKPLSVPPAYFPDEPPAWIVDDEPEPPASSPTVANQEQRPERKAIWTVEELLSAEFPEPTWVIPGILPTGLASLAGRPKIGKSWLALQWAIAVGSGGRVFDKQVEQRRVLYFALEDGERRLQERLRKQHATRDAKIDFRLGILPLAKGGAATLLRAAESKEYGMIVIDTFSRAAGRVDQMDLAVTGELVGCIQRAAIDNDTLILIVDHHRKNAGNGNNDPVDDVMGSTGKTAPLDVAVGLYRERGKKEATLKITGRDIEEQELSIAHDQITGIWQLMGTAQGVRTESVQAAILNAIAEYGGAATTQQVAQFLKKDAGNVSRELGELVTKGVIAKGAREGRQVQYSIANHVK